MAARTRKGTKDVPMPESWREKIRSTEIMNRMQAFFFGEVQLSAEQLRAAQIILGKVIPDLARTDTTITLNPHEASLDELR